MKDKHTVAAFTLVEVLVTVVILSVGIVGILYSFDASMTALSKAREALFCEVMCNDKLSEIESDIIIGNMPDVTSSGSFDGMFKDYQWNMKSSLVPPNRMVDSAGDGSDNDAGMKVDLYKVKVFVWRNGDPDNKSVALTYLRL